MIMFRVLGDCVNVGGTTSHNVLFIGEKSLLKYFKIIGDEISNNEIPDLTKEIQKVSERERREREVITMCLL